MDTYFIDKLPDELPKFLKDKIINNGEIEIVFRDVKKKFEQFIKLIFKPKQDKPNIHPDFDNPNKVEALFPNLKTIISLFKNKDLMMIFNTAVSIAGLAATMAGNREICSRLDHIEEQLREIKQDLKEQKEINFEVQINLPCRKLVSSYKNISDSLQKGEHVSKKELVEIIDSCQHYIITLFSLRDKYSLNTALNMIFMLLPIMYNCIMIYYQQNFDPAHPHHVSHEDWMGVFDMLLAPDFIDEVQDYMFIDQHKTNLEVNEYLFTHRSVVYGFKLKINELIEDMIACKDKEGYDEAMRLSRLYAIQQAKAMEPELTNRFGPEKAKVLMSEMMAIASA